MSLVLALEHWPDADRFLWEDLVREGGPLDDRGPLSHLRETSRQTLINHYGRWLAWVQQTEPEALSVPPVQRATLDRLQRWLDDLSHTRPMSRLVFIGDVIRLLRAADPNQDWTRHLWVKRALKRLAGHGDRSRKQGRVVSSRLLFERGIKHATQDADVATTDLEAMKRRRNGTMVALLALIPMRRRAYVRLELGMSLLVQEDRILIALPGELTKNGLPFSCSVPDAIVPLLQTYIFEVRPWFLKRGSASHNVLWVRDRGAPYDDNYFGARIAQITTRLTGVRVPPHFFRDAAATTLARSSSNAAQLIRPVLSHTSSGTAERHYIQANSLEAGRNLAELVRRRKRS